ncbi:hypothetical protein DPB93_19840 [Salmonella enterica subsp. salamae]|nr:hypothetical protein [Salmonella enterica subsp. salamae]
MTTHRSWILPSGVAHIIISCLIQIVILTFLVDLRQKGLKISTIKFVKECLCTYIHFILQTASLLAALRNPGHIVIYASGDFFSCRRDAS